MTVARALPRQCGWCRSALEQTPSSGAAKYCGTRCRQAAFRLRRRREQLVTAAEPGRFAYADPPYPGLSSKYYRNEPTFAGEVDHAALIASLAGGGYTGWALSTSAKSLRYVLPLCPPDVRVASWVKPIGVSSRTFGIHNTWEPLIVWGGRKLRGGKRDWLSAQPARYGGELPGRKPIAFIAWMFDLLGASPGAGDTFEDWFPGTGVVGRAWQALGGTLLPRGPSDATAPGDGVCSSAERRASPGDDGDVEATP